MPGAKYHCAACGAELSDEAGDPCPRCGGTGRSVTVFVDGLKAEFSLGSPGVVTEERTQDEIAISVKTPLGVISKSRQDSVNVDLSVTGRPDVGRPAERSIQEILAQRLVNEGRAAAAKEGADDSRGEDGLLVIDDRQYTLQATTVPRAPAFWKDLHSSGSAATSVSHSRAAQWIHEAIESKAHKLPAAARGSIVLALDARHAGVIAEAAVKAEYLTKYGAAESEFGFAAIWIVGPTPSNCSQL